MSEQTFGTVSAAELMEGTATLYRQADQARLARLEAVAELDRTGAYGYDGYTSVTAFLVHRGGLGAGEAKREVFLARALEHMPYAVKLAEAGRLSVNQLEVLAHLASRHPDQFASDEATLAEAVAGLRLSDTRRVADTGARPTATPTKQKPSRPGCTCRAPSGEEAGWTGTWTPSCEPCWRRRLGP